MATEEGLHESDVDPAEEVGIGGAVGDGFSFSVLVFSLHALVHRVDAICFTGDRRGGGKGRHGEPANGAGETSQGIAFVAGVFLDAGEAAGMEGLHEQGADATDECGHVAVGDPRSFIGKVESGVIARSDIGKPRWDAIRITGEEDTEAFGKEALEGVILQERRRAETLMRYTRNSDEQGRRKFDLRQGCGRELGIKNADPVLRVGICEEN